MGLTKHGSGEVLPDPEDNVKVARQHWTEADRKDLARENERDDEPGRNPC